MKNTVADLIALLSQMPQDRVVLLSSDEEGNSFNTWSGDHGLATNNQWREWSSYIYDEDDNEREITEEEAKAVILWP